MSTDCPARIMFLTNNYVCKQINYATRKYAPVQCEFPRMNVAVHHNDAATTALSYQIKPNTKSKLSLSAPSSSYQFQVTPKFASQTSSNTTVVDTTQYGAVYDVNDTQVLFSDTGVALNPKLPDACNTTTELAEPSQPSALVVFSNRTVYQASVAFNNAPGYGPNAYDCKGQNVFVLEPHTTRQYVATPSASFVMTVIDAFGIPFQSYAVIPYGLQSKLVFPFKNDIGLPFAVMTVPPMVGFVPDTQAAYPNGIMNIVLDTVEAKDYLFSTAYAAPSIVQPMPAYQIALIAVFSVLAAAGVAALIYYGVRKLRAPRSNNTRTI